MWNLENASYDKSGLLNFSGVNTVQCWIYVYNVSYYTLNLFSNWLR